MIPILVIGILIILGAGPLVYPEQTMKLFSKVGITLFSGLKNQATRNNRFRGLVVLIGVALAFLILGGLQIQVGVAALILGVLLVYYSSQLACSIGTALPPMGGMTPNTALNIAGVLLVLFGVGWMTGLLQGIIVGVLGIFAS